MEQPFVLIAEDDPAGRLYMEMALRESGYGVRGAADGAEALRAIEERVPDAVVTDLRMPRLDGLALLGRIGERWGRLPVIVVTVEEDVATVVEAVRQGAVNYLVKPVSPPVLRDAVRKALLLASAPPPVEPALDGIVGMSKAIAGVREHIRLAARTDVNVLITGETGTGKELAARAIHGASNLRDGPFVAHNCAATPRDLFDSEFFGHRRGAFTGADRDHTGLLERAHGGVLFLDELESLDGGRQATLLRVMDDGEVLPLGAGEPRRVSVRFLAATNRDAPGMIRDGSLREDLYYRLRGIEIALPPLRDRREDIPLLACHFLDDPGGAFTPLAMQALVASPWPGNVRQLRNVVRRAQAAAAGSPIAVHRLGLGRAEAEVLGKGVPGATLRDVERAAILRALGEAGGNRTLAARSLGIDRSTLRRKITDLGIESGRRA